MPQSHWLIIQDDKGQRGVILDRLLYSIGRDPQCDIHLVSQFVSRHHAFLEQIPHADGTYSYRIVDGTPDGKPSSNGLLINGRRLRTRNLENEDEVTFGPKVRAVYYFFERDTDISFIPDEFDITLISPNMVGEPELLPEPNQELEKNLLPDRHSRLKRGRKQRSRLFYL